MKKKERNNRLLKRFLSRANVNLGKWAFNGNKLIGRSILSFNIRYDQLVHLFLKGKSTRKEEQELLNIILKDLNYFLVTKKKIDRSVKKEGVSNV